MLKGISPLLSPELLKVLDEMGHGDEIVFCRCEFSNGQYRKTKLYVQTESVQWSCWMLFLQLFPLDQYDEDHFVLMEVVPGRSGSDADLG